eukprot:9479791-Pyramimonas_sp.AAC.3
MLRFRMAVGVGADMARMSTQLVSFCCAGLRISWASWGRCCYFEPSWGGCVSGPLVHLRCHLEQSSSISTAIGCRPGLSKAL